MPLTISDVGIRKIPNWEAGRGLGAAGGLSLVGSYAARPVYDAAGAEASVALVDVGDAPNGT